MCKLSLRRICAKLRQSRGVAAVEFALVAPIMIALFCAIIELTGLLMVERKIIAATQTVSDLVTQETTVTSTDLDDIITAARLIFDPYPTGMLTFNIASIRFNTTSGAPELIWQRLVGGSPGGSDILTQAVGMGQPGEGIVISYLTYSYTPLFGTVITSAITLDEMSFSRPRRSPTVTCASVSCS
ncbi:MAG: pilus assembly protein [Alphaproteobacteria bacterium]|nr:pilus assembly protein [Alphaproteobacteria bacterium]